MRLDSQIEIDKRAKYYARRALTIGGITYVKGDHVPHGLLDDRRFLTFVEGRTLIHERNAASLIRRQDDESAAGGDNPGGSANGAAAGAVKAGGDKEPRPGGALGGDPIEGTAEEYIQHLGRGWFLVYFHGESAKERGAGPAAERLKAFREAAGQSGERGVSYRMGNPDDTETAETLQEGDAVARGGAQNDPEGGSRPVPESGDDANAGEGRNADPAGNGRESGAGVADRGENGDDGDGEPMTAAELQTA